MARRNRTQEPNALVAAARRLPLDDMKAARRLTAKAAKWQEDAWLFFDEVPEVKFAVLFIGNSLGKVQFFAATRNADGEIVPVDAVDSPHVTPLEDGTVIPNALAVQAVHEMSRLHSESGGQAELNRLAAMNLEVPGEFYLVGYGQRLAQDGVSVAAAEYWDVRSISEVELLKEPDQEGRPRYRVKDHPEDKDGVLLDPTLDTIIRVYQRHPQWKALADSHMRGILTDSETLVILTNQLKAEGKSRQGAGILCVPTELSFTGGDGGNTPSGNGQDQTQDPFIAALMQAITAPIEDPSDAASVMPLVLRGPAEYLTPDRLRLLTLGRTTDATVDQRIKDRIDRIARGLDVPVEVVMGHMATTFSNAEQVDQDTFDDHLEPKCVTLAETYTIGFLQPQLSQAAPMGGWTPEQQATVFVHFDASALVQDNALAAVAREALAVGAISKAAYRRLRNLAEEDAPDEVEALRNLAEKKGFFTADLTASLLRMGGVALPELPKSEALPAGSPSDITADVQVGEVGPEMAAFTPAQRDVLDRLASALLDVLARQEGGGDGGPKVPALTAGSRPVASLGRRLADLDRTLRARILGAAEAAVERALERAGNRLKSKAGTLRDTLRTVPPYRAAAHLGPSLVASAGVEVDDLLVGAFDTLHVQFDAWVLDAAAQAFDLVAEAAPRDISPRRDAYLAGVKAALPDAWGVLLGHLTLVATTALWDPETGREGSGRVLPGHVRDALRIVGGWSGKYGVVVAASRPSAPVDGLALGEDIHELLADGGLAVEAFRWDYGASIRQFEPHKKLDGKVFLNFDDDVLRNRDDWPDTPYFYPGDHPGCGCDFEPTIVEAEPDLRTTPVDQLSDRNLDDALDAALADARTAYDNYTQLLFTDGVDPAKLQAAKRASDEAGSRAAALRHAKFDTSPPSVPVPQRRIDDASLKLHRALVDRQGELDLDVRDALQVYESEGYRAMNAGRSGYSAEKALIDAAFTKTDQPTVLYRGMTDLSSFRQGEVVKSKGYVSTTADPNMATAFSRSSGGVLGMASPSEIPTVLRITVRGNRPTLAIPDSPELEVLLPRGSKLRVLGEGILDTDTGRIRIIDVEV